MATELQRQSGTGVATQEPDEFAALLKQSFKPRNERAASEVESAVATLVTTALADATLLKDDVLDTLEAMIAAIDKQLSDQVNEILHAAAARRQCFGGADVDVRPEVEHIAGGAGRNAERSGKKCTAPRYPA